MKPLFWPTLILALAALPVAAQAGPGRGPGRGPGHGPRADIAQALKLSEAQKASIQAIRDKHKPTMVLRRDSVQQAQTALRAATQDPATPEAQLRALFDKASAARFDMMLARRSVHQAVQALLTPEQRAQAAELRGKAQGRMHERVGHLRMDRRGGMGMGG